eukprot:SAG22_NODE_3124_length_1918_cov_1.345794_2_plen_187_part_01
MPGWVSVKAGDGKPLLMLVKQQQAGAGAGAGGGKAGGAAVGKGGSAGGPKGKPAAGMFGGGKSTMFAGAATAKVVAAKAKKEHVKVQKWPRGKIKMMYRCTQNRVTIRKGYEKTTARCVRHHTLVLRASFHFHCAVRAVFLCLALRWSSCCSTSNTGPACLPACPPARLPACLPACLPALPACLPAC